MTQRALIIGGNKGIGRQIAIRLASDGYDVFVSGRDGEQLKLGVVAECESMNLKIGTLVFDITSPAAIKEQYDLIFGNNTPDIVVFNAGCNSDNLFAFMSEREWTSVLRTNVDGFFNTVQPLVGDMVSRKFGRIIVISSVSGQTGQIGQVNYSAAKAALIGAAKALAREVARKNVLVNVIAPGVIDTDMTKDLPKEHVLPLIPQRRYGTTSEIAGVVSFLCGSDSSYITGQVLAVNGGMYI